MLNGVGFADVLVGLLTLAFLGWAGIVYAATQRVKEIATLHSTALARVEEKVVAIEHRLAHIETNLL